MAILWVICGEKHEDGRVCECKKKAGPIKLSDGPGCFSKDDRLFGEHNYRGERCLGSDKPPRASFWGDRMGRFFRWEIEL